jgi:hypothetical protein
MRQIMYLLSIVLLSLALFAAPSHATTTPVWSTNFGQNVGCDVDGAGNAIQKIKLQFGVDGTFVDVSSSNPLPVTGGGGGGGGGVVQQGGLDSTAAPWKVTQVNANGSISNQAVGTTPVTFTAPANAVGFVLESESTNAITTCRWAVGSAASASVGVLLEAGRDTGYIPAAANVSVYCATAAQAIDVQWVLSQ